MSEKRVIDCPDCEGAGSYETYGPLGFGTVITCRFCDGTGRQEIELEPIDAEDLDEIPAP